MKKHYNKIIEKISNWLEKSQIHSTVPMTPNPKLGNRVGIPAPVPVAGHHRPRGT